jgi:hypothetical protein
MRIERIFVEVLARISSSASPQLKKLFFFLHGTFTDGIYLLSLLFSRFVKEKVCCFFSTGLENFGSRRSEK